MVLLNTLGNIDCQDLGKPGVYMDGSSKDVDMKKYNLAKDLA